MSAVTVVPTTTEVVRDELVALRRGAGIALIVATVLASTVGLYALLPPIALWGFGLGLTVTPLTAAVLAAVRDPDLGEASAINDAAARLGGVIAIAAVPALIGATGGTSLGHALASGDQPAMIAAAGLTAGAAVIAALFVTNDRMVGPRVAAPAPYHACPLPDSAPSSHQRQQPPEAS